MLLNKRNALARGVDGWNELNTALHAAAEPLDGAKSDDVYGNRYVQ